MKASPHKPASGTSVLEKQRISGTACALRVPCVVPSLLRIPAFPGKEPMPWFEGQKSTEKMRNFSA